MTGRAAAKRAVLIAGATASGKSALALALAEELGGSIINADSMQVYRDLRIITARPAAAEEARIPHLLYGHVDAAENYSVGRWCVDARAALAAVERAGRLPIVVGGTGLYFKALTQGLAAVPPIPAGIRSAVRDRLKTEGIAPLYAELCDRDPATARRLGPVIAPASPARSRWSWRPGAPSPTGTAKAWNPQSPPTARSRSSRRRPGGALPPHRRSFRCDARGRRAGGGARARQRALDAALPAMKAHGVPWLIRSLKGEIGSGASRRGGKARHPSLHQAPGHLVPPSAAGLDLGRPRHGAGRDPAAARALTCGLLPPDGERGDCKAGGKHPPGRPHLRVEVEVGQQHAPRVDAAREHVDERFADRGHRGRRNGEKEKRKRGHLAVAPE